MESLAQRTAQTLSRHPAPAVAFHEVVELARGSGMAVTEPVLLQSLKSAPDQFRVLGPWRGRWATLPSEPWLIPLGAVDRPDEGPACLRRVRACLVWLGRSVDDRSALEMARWFALVREEERLRAAGAPPVAGAGGPSGAAS